MQSPGGEEDGPLVVRCLDDGQSYVVDPSKSGLVETSGTIIGVVKQKDENHFGIVVRDDNAEDGLQDDSEDSKHSISRKARRGQRLRESVGLKAKTKDVEFEAARHRLGVHRQRLAKLQESLAKRDGLLRQLVACESDLGARLADLAAASPIEAAAASLSRDFARTRQMLESSVLPESSEAFSELISRWCDELDKADQATFRDQDDARIQLDHYQEKASVLRKAKEKRDLAALEKAANDAKNEIKSKASTKNAAADEKLLRNEAKLKTARADYEEATAAAIRVYDSAVLERWHDLTPLLGRILAFEMTLAKLRGHDAEPNLRECHQTLQNIPTNLIPLRSRLYFAKMNQAPLQKMPLIEAAAEETQDDQKMPVRAPPSPPKIEEEIEEVRADDNDSVEVVDEQSGNIIVADTLPTPTASIVTTITTTAS